MVKDIASYCTSCEICARTKAPNQKPMGLLHPLPVPHRPWEQIGVDFVGPLPEARGRNGAFDQIMVVIDHLTSMVHLVPTRTSYRARQVTEAFFDSVYRLHGLPERIVSDRDKIFTAQFWKSHPQTDGATERANRTMMQMIVQAINGKDSKWLDRLPAIEWAMNAARSETTGFSPFFLNYGHRPRPLLWKNPGTNEYPGVHIFAQRMKDAIMRAHDAILERRVKQVRIANRSRRQCPIESGDKVYLSTKNLKQLELPDFLKERGVHNAFHASLLKIHIPNCDLRFPGRQFEQLAAFGGEDDTWEPLEKVRELEALVEYLEVMDVTDVTKLPRGSGIPPRDDPEVFVALIAEVSGNTHPTPLLPSCTAHHIHFHSPCCSPPPTMPSNPRYHPSRDITPPREIAGTRRAGKQAARRVTQLKPFKPDYTHSQSSSIPKRHPSTRMKEPFEIDEWTLAGIAITIARKASQPDVARQIEEIWANMTVHKISELASTVANDPDSFFIKLGIPPKQIPSVPRAHSIPRPQSSSSDAPALRDVVQLILQGQQDNHRFMQQIVSAYANISIKQPKLIAEAIYGPPSSIDTTTAEADIAKVMAEFEPKPITPALITNKPTEEDTVMKDAVDTKFNDDEKDAEGEFETIDAKDANGVGNKDGGEWVQAATQA